MNTRIPFETLVVCCLACACSSESPKGGGDRAAEENARSSLEKDVARTAGSESLSFAQTSPGALPDDWHIGGTHQQGPPATWQIVADPTAPTPPNALALTSAAHGSGSTFNLCWNERLHFQDGVIELAFKANRGEEDRGGGPIWRLQDENNYYVCRANPLESNFRLYVVKDGERKQLASTKVEVTSGTWHRIRVEHSGTRIACILDGTVRLEATDDQLPEAGGVGLWTKADAETAFDDLEIR